MANLNEQALSAKDAKKIIDAIRELQENQNNNQGSSIDIDTIFPVGSIYLSTKDVSPAEMFGGSWMQQTGTFLYCGTQYGTGNGTGTSVGSTALTAAQSGLPSHNHGASYSGANFYARQGNQDGTYTLGAGANTWIDRNAGETWKQGFSTTSRSHAIDRVNIGGSVSVSANGGWNASQGHTHTVPYISIYCWIRTE